MEREEVEQKIIEKASKDGQFKSNLINNPKKILNQEFGLELPDNISLEVLEEKPDKFYLVLPVDKNKIALSDEMLDNVAGGRPGYEGERNSSVGY
jgi:hypothetical protein